jgi:hypothetical protein
MTNVETTTVRINDSQNAVITFLRNQNFYTDIDITIESQRYNDIDFSIDRNKLPAFIAALQEILNE